MENSSLLLLAGAIGAVVGTLVTAVTNFVLTVVSRRSEERRQLNELMVNAAIAQFKQDVDIAKHRAGPSRIPPLGNYIIYNYMLVSVLGNRGYKTKQLKQKLRQISRDHEELVRAMNFKNQDGTPSDLT